MSWLDRFFVNAITDLATVIVAVPPLRAVLTDVLTLSMDPATSTDPGTMPPADKIFLDSLHAAAGTAIPDSDSTIVIGDGAWRRVAAGSQTNNRTTTLGTTGAAAGTWMLIERLDVSAFTRALVNGGGGGGTLITLPGYGISSALFQFDGTNWALRDFSTFVPLSTGTPSSVGATSVVGTGITAARDDHAHEHGTQTLFGHIAQISTTLDYTELTGLGAGVTSFSNNIGGTQASRFLLAVYIKPEFAFTDGAAGVYDLDVGVTGGEGVLASNLLMSAGVDTSNPIAGNGVSHFLGHPLTTAQYKLRLQSTVDLNTSTNGYVAVKLIYYYV